MRTLLPMDRLEPGTQVLFRSFRGVVLEANQKRDQHGGPIMIHTIRLEQRRERQGNKTIWRKLEAYKTIAPNYSFVTVL